MLNENFRHQADLVLTILGYMDWDGCFAMKGGTALNFFYEDMPRLSVDIDLVYLPIHSRDQSFDEMKKVFKKYTADFTRRGFTARVIGVNKGNPVGKLYVSNHLASIKIEPNLVMRGVLVPTQIKPLSLAVKELFQQDLKDGVRCLDYKEIMAGKLVAMLDRQHPRDIFDLLNYYKHKESIKDFMDHFIIYLLQSNRPFSEVLNPNLMDIESVFNTSFIGMPKEPVDLKKLLACREKVVKDLHDCLQSRHKEFLVSVMEEKPMWELMPFKHLDQLPGIKWRLQNLRAISEGKRKEEILKLRNL